MYYIFKKNCYKIINGVLLSLRSKLDRSMSVALIGISDRMVPHLAAIRTYTTLVPAMVQSVEQLPLMEQVMCYIEF